MKQAYPIIVKRDVKYCVVFIPDFELNTQGETIAEAMEMARDAIGMAGCYLMDEGREIPTASLLNNTVAEAGELLTLVDVDFSEYRRKHSNRAIRKNLTIPYWLNEAAEAAGLNFSAVLQKALKRELQITER